MNRLIEHIIRFPKRYIAIMLLLTLLMGYFASKVTINPDIETLIPKDDRLSELMEVYDTGTSDFDYLALVIESVDPFKPEILAAYYKAIEKIASFEFINGSTSPFNLVTFQSSGRKIEIVAVNPASGPPETEEEIALFKKRLLSSPFAEQIVSRDGRILCTYFPSGKVEDYNATMEELQSLVEELSRVSKTYLTGSIPFIQRILYYLTRDLVKLLSAGMAVILILFYLGFRAKRAVTLPVSVVLMGTLWSLGFMGLAGYTLTVVSIIAPPLVLTLGSSYSIHLLNQYYREAPLHAENNLWIAEATVRITKTIFLAAITTVIGFASLIPSAMKQTKEFGLSVSAGIIACALLSLFFLPAALSLLSLPREKQKNLVTQGLLARLMERIGKGVIKRRYLLAGLLLVIIVLFLITYPSLVYQTNFMKYFPSGERIIQDTEFINQNISSFQTIQITFSAPAGEENYFLKPEVLSSLAAFEEQLKSIPNVRTTASLASFMEKLNEMQSGVREIPKSRGLISLLARYVKIFNDQASSNSFIGNLVNSNFTIFTISMSVYDPYTKGFLYDKDMAQLIKIVQELVDSQADPQLKPEIWGNSLRFTNLSMILSRDQRVSIVISVILVFLVSTLFLCSLYCGVMAIVPLITGVMLNFIFMVVFSIPLDMTTIMVACVAIGVGVDNSIHFLIQFQRQRAILGDNPDRVIPETMAVAGRPIFLTTLSIVCGLFVLTLSSFKPIAFFGYLISGALLSTLFGTLFILPACLSLFWKRYRARGNR